MNRQIKKAMREGIIISRMTILFNESNVPTIVHRKLALVARIIAAVASKPLTPYEIRKAIEAEPDFSWAKPLFIWETVTHLAQSKRLIRSCREGRAVHVFGLPEEPFAPSEDQRANEETRREIDVRIIGSLVWPKFFHVPSRDELLPSTKTRTGYDPLVDMNRF